MTTLLYHTLNGQTRIIPTLIDLGLPSGVRNGHVAMRVLTNQTYGSYYAWGETEKKKVYDKSTYKFYQNGNYVNIGSDISGTEHDVAHVKWGGNWVGVLPRTTSMNWLTTAQANGLR